MKWLVTAFVQGVAHSRVVEAATVVVAIQSSAFSPYDIISVVLVDAKGHAY